MISKQRMYTILFYAILVIGLSMRFYQYLFGRSLWEDEAHLALNFIYFGYKDLLKPLAHFQSAPILFLFTVETFTRLFGFSEYALRAFPFISAILSLPLLYYIILLLTKSKPAALIGFALYAVNVYTNYYAAELKPYIVDAAVYLLLVYLVLSQQTTIQKHRIRLLTVLGCLAITLSMAAVVVLACVALYYMQQWYANKKIVRQQLYMFLAWGTTFMLYFFFFIFHHPYGHGMREIWAFTFCPINIFSKAFVDFIVQTTRETFFTWVLHISDAFGFAWVVLLVMLSGTAYIFYHKKYTILYFTWLPVLLHLGLSMVKIYPFYTKFIFYLEPAFMILLAIGTYAIAQFLAQKTHTLVGNAFVMYCMYFYLMPSWQQFPNWYREIKPCINFINSNYPNMHIYTTTPSTLYEYYTRVGYAANTNFEYIEWNLSPEKYYALVAQQKSNYLLLSSDSSCGYIDGYTKVFEDLHKRNLIVRQFSYRTYLVSEIKPLGTLDKK